MRRKLRKIGAGHAGIVMLLVATFVVSMLSPVGMQRASAQDLAIQTRVQILHAAPDVGKIEVHINYDEVADEFTYGQQSDWIDFTPGAARVTITADRAGFNYAIFDAVYPAPAGNDYYMAITSALVLAGTFDRSPVPDGSARVVVVQGSVALPAVNVTAKGEDSAWATQLGYGRTSEAAIVPAGSYDLEVSLADGGDVAISAPGTVLDANSTYVLIIMGQPNDTDHPLEIRALVTRPRRGMGRRRQPPNALEARPATFGPGGRPPLGSTTGQRGCRRARVKGTYVPLTRRFIARRRAMAYTIPVRPTTSIVRADEIVAIGNNTVRPGKLHDNIIYRRATDPATRAPRSTVRTTDHSWRRATMGQLRSTSAPGSKAGMGRSSAPSSN